MESEVYFRDALHCLQRRVFEAVSTLTWEFVKFNLGFGLFEFHINQHLKLLVFVNFSILVLLNLRFLRILVFVNLRCFWGETCLRRRRVEEAVFTWEIVKFNLGLNFC